LTPTIEDPTGLLARLETVACGFVSRSHTTRGTLAGVTARQLILPAMLALLAAASARTIEGDTPQLGIGSPVPALTLRDGKGAERSVRELAGARGLILLFVRDGGSALASAAGAATVHTARLAAAGVNLVAVVPRTGAVPPPAGLQVFTDPGDAASRSLGLASAVRAPPAAFVTGAALVRDGTLAARAEQPTAGPPRTIGSLLAHLGQPTGTMTATTRGEQLNITTHASDEVAQYGQRLSLVLDVAPRPKIHVYAPGKHDYQAISVELDPLKGLSTAPLVYPPSEIYYFEPLDERVPVYQKPFRLVQDVWVDPALLSAASKTGAGTVRMTGRVSYQACDDRICFRPQTVKVAWELRTPADSSAPR
jgi:Disulphide bond corrector protein DsbC